VRGERAERNNNRHQPAEAETHKKDEKNSANVDLGFSLAGPGASIKVHCFALHLATLFERWSEAGSRRQPFKDTRS
jgi:hypothetical protein